jgi:hypothetical protein
MDIAAVIIIMMTMILLRYLYCLVLQATISQRHIEYADGMVVITHHDDLLISFFHHGHVMGVLKFKFAKVHSRGSHDSC